MSKQSPKLVKQLEARIEELTQALDRAEHRLEYQSLQLETSTEIDQAATASILDINKLNGRITRIIKNRFKLYHVGIYLIDSSNRWAVYNRGAGKASRKLKQDGFRLPLEGESIVAWVSQTREPGLASPSGVTGLSNNGKEADHLQSLLLSKARAELVLPLISNNQLIGILDTQSVEEDSFTPNKVKSLRSLADQIASIIERAQLYVQTAVERDRTNLLFEISAALSTKFDPDSVAAATVGLADRLGAAFGEIYLLSDSGNLYFKSSLPERNKLAASVWQSLVRRTLSQGLEAWVLKTGQPALVSDTKTDDRWLPIEDQGQAFPIRSAICIPVSMERDGLRGAISYVHTEPNHFDQQDLALLKAVASQVAIALEKSTLLDNVQNNLQRTNLILQVSRKLSRALNLKEVYTALVEGVISTGAERCVLYSCDDLDVNNVPQISQVVFVEDIDPEQKNEGRNNYFSIQEYPLYHDIARGQEPVVIENVESDHRLTPKEKEFMQRFDTRSLVIVPLIARSYVTGLVSIEYRTARRFSEREVAIYRTLCNQATTAIENARQVERTAAALAGTQSLYRAGRVLASTDNLQQTLEEALVEFLYSLNLDQGGITLLTPDKQQGQLMAYVQNYELQDTKNLHFPIDRENIPYQKLLLAGQPFVSADAPQDPRLVNFRSFNVESGPKSLLQAPLILKGETIGWIGADAVKEYRDFSQSEIDLARAMADQVSISIQNHRLLEQTQRRAEQFQAVAEVGEAVSGLIDLDEVLGRTVNLIRDRFDFYHVSIFLIEESKKWAVVRASTGEIGRIMVERPHRLEVGGKSIVGVATAKAKPRIALDVGQDAVHFENPLLPHTRSEMALPLISRGTVIGALDVQSVEANAFDDEAVAILQVMANQLAAAIENARLFEQTQRRLMEQAMLYNLGTKISATLNLQEATDDLVVETSQILDVAKCSLVMLEEDDTICIASDYVKPTSAFPDTQGERYELQLSPVLSKIVSNKRDFFADIKYLPDEATGLEIEYLKAHRGTALAIVPVIIRNKVSAFLTVYDDKTGRHFTQEDISLLDSIALQAANAIENARLFESAQESLERTQSLYNISDALATAVDQQVTFETVLGEYLRLINLKKGSIMLLDRAGERNKVEALYVDGQPAKPTRDFEVQHDPVTQYLLEQPEPLAINDVHTHPLTKDSQELRSSETEAILFIPLIFQGQTVGLIAADSSEKGYTFTKSDIALGEAIADQLSIWLENRQLLEEAQYRSNLLQTAAQVSGAASSILDTDQLIETSVNLIRDHFDFYYVGLFLVNKTKDWAVLRAGTGEAGRIQVEKGHQLEIGGESMIGWAVKNRQARIALDVGEDAVWFNNPYLPDTHSEMALPLVSRDEVIGALTVQSIERGAFSEEDITVLQTMADQLANAIANARLFETTQKAAHREAIIREISGKIRGSVSMDDIMQITVTELSKILGSSKGGITLDIDSANNH